MGLAALGGGASGSEQTRRRDPWTLCVWAKAWRVADDDADAADDEPTSHLSQHWYLVFDEPGFLARTILCASRFRGSVRHRVCSRNCGGHVLTGAASQPGIMPAVLRIPEPRNSRDGRGIVRGAGKAGGKPLHVRARKFSM